MEGKRVAFIAVFVICCGIASLLFVSGKQNMALRAMGGSYAESWKVFQEWMAKQNKFYKGMDDLEERYKIFHDNYVYIQYQNSLGKKHKLAINKFADMTKEEFKAKYLNLKSNKNAVKNIKNDPTVNLPDEIDWTDKGPVTPVKDQGQCGSCWAFSTTGGLEAAYYQKYGQLVSFSEQQLVDCSGDQGNYGCDGGLQEYAYAYLQDNGAELESDYPYTAYDDSCQYDSSKAVVRVSNYVNTDTNELALKASVALRPTPVSVDAETWQFYGGGILEEDCGTELDHAVLAVGYGSENGNLYWKIKNSWGTGWGEDGFIRLQRTDDSSSQGQCGVAADPLYPEL